MGAMSGAKPGSHPARGPERTATHSTQAQAKKQTPHRRAPAGVTPTFSKPSPAGRHPSERFFQPPKSPKPDRQTPNRPSATTRRAETKKTKHSRQTKPPAAPPRSRQKAKPPHRSHAMAVKGRKSRRKNNSGDWILDRINGIDAIFTMSAAWQERDGLVSERFSIGPSQPKPRAGRRKHIADGPEGAASRCASKAKVEPPRPLARSPRGWRAR